VNEEKRLIADCPNCQGARWANVKGEYGEPEQIGDSVFGGNVVRILKCCGCDVVYAQMESWSSNQIEHFVDPSTGQGSARFITKFHYWPSHPKRPRPSWRPIILATDITLFQIVEELYSAYDSGLQVLTAIGIRTAFERSSFLLGVDSSLSFSRKLQALYDAGHVGKSEQEALEVLTDAGSAAAHRAWCPSEDELAIMLTVLEQFISRTLVVQNSILKLKSAVPPRIG